MDISYASPMEDQCRSTWVENSPNSGNSINSSLFVSVLIVGIKLNNSNIHINHQDSWMLTRFTSALMHDIKSILLRGLIIAQLYTKQHPLWTALGSHCQASLDPFQSLLVPYRRTGFFPFYRDTALSRLFRWHHLPSISITSQISKPKLRYLSFTVCKTHTKGLFDKRIELNPGVMIRPLSTLLAPMLFIAAYQSSPSVLSAF